MDSKSNVKILPQSYYTHDDVTGIAKGLLGKILVTNIGEHLCKGMIVETEAYRAPDDKACHAFNEKVTPRTQTMFEAGGVAYVYICYGIHRMINVVTSKKGNAHAVLIRAVKPIVGNVTMAARRGHEAIKKDTTNGPGKLCKAMAIGTDMDGLPLYQNNTIWIEDHDIHISEQEIIAGPRVGLSKLTGADAHRPWRYYIMGSKYVSSPKVVNYPQEWKLL